MFPIIVGWIKTQALPIDEIVNSDYENLNLLLDNEIKYRVINVHTNTCPKRGYEIIFDIVIVEKPIISLDKSIGIKKPIMIEKNSYIKL